MLLKIEFSSLVFEDDVDETWGRCTSASLARPILWLSRWLWPMLCPWPVSEVMSGDGSVLTFAWPLSLSSSGLIGTRLESMAWVWPCSASWWEDDGDHGSRGHSDDGDIWYPSWLELVSTEENVSIPGSGPTCGWCWCTELWHPLMQEGECNNVWNERIRFILILI